MIERKKAILATSIFVAIIIIFTTIYYQQSINVEQFGKSYLSAGDRQGNTTYPEVLASYMNPDNNTLGGYYTYFPFTMQTDKNVTIALISPGPHITLAPTNVSYGSFGLEFGLAMLKGSNSWDSKTSFSVNDASIRGNNSSFHGGFIGIEKMTYPSGHSLGAYQLPFALGSAFIVFTSFLNSTGGKLTHLSSGIYYLNVNLSIFSFHVFFKSFIGYINLSIPWAIMKDNYTGNSYGYTG